MIDTTDNARSDKVKKIIMDDGSDSLGLSFIHAYEATTAKQAVDDSPAMVHTNPLTALAFIMI